MRSKIYGKIRRKSGPPLSFPCLNCDDPAIIADQVKLFCSEKCKEEAKSVRYARRCIREGRTERPDVREAIEIRFAMILGGGYPERERSVSPSVRRAVIARAGGRCQQCGKRGTDIDHMKGNSNNIEDLQLLCRTCHNEKTTAGFLEITPKTEGYEELMATARRLQSRVRASVPKRRCDDDEHWDKLYPRILLRRQNALKKKSEQANRAQ
jgi:5-methylcytosine-specific restriction endonuclease McrA